MTKVKGYILLKKGQRQKQKALSVLHAGIINNNSFTSQYSTVVLTVVRVMIAKYRKSGNWGYRSSLTPEPIELKLYTSDYVDHRTPHAPRGN